MLVSGANLLKQPAKAFVREIIAVQNRFLMDMA
jgi:hypothetical protein